MWPFAKKVTTHLCDQQPTRPAPPMPEIKPAKPEETISEPVLSIIETLKNGEWDYQPSVDIASVRLVVAVHEWFGKKISCYSCTRLGYDGNFNATLKTSYYSESWMSKMEQEMVSELVYKLIQDRWDAGKAKRDEDYSNRLAQQRASFMCLVPNNKEL